MTHFEAYRWEDHVPRAGSWKVNLAAGLLALGLIYAALPQASGDAPPAAAATLPAPGVRDSEMAISPVKGQWAHREKENERRALCPPLA